MRRGYRAGLKVQSTGFSRKRKDPKNSTKIHVEGARVQRVVRPVGTSRPSMTTRAWVGVNKWTVDRGPVDSREAA